VVEERTHNSFENDVKTNGGDESTDPRLASFRLFSQTFGGDVLVVENHGFRHVAISETEGGRKEGRESI